VNILLVDDEPDLRFLLRVILEGSGHRVREAANGAEALELARAEKPELILTDLMMPIMDGAVLIELLRGDECLARVPVVLVSAVPEPGVNADAVIRKPFSPDQIIAIAQRFSSAR
jgi:CheY-like chemotaxis protein